MLYFSKIKIITVIFVTLVFAYLSFSNLFKFDDNYVKNKINLGLDLQGGSYLLLKNFFKSISLFCKVCEIIG